MKIMKAAFRSTGGEWKTCDFIEYQRKLWLVARWLENQGLGIAKPERIVQMDCLQYTDQIPEGLQTQVNLVVLTPIPEFVFDPRISTPMQPPYVAIDHPNITVELSSGLSSLH